MVAKPLDGRLVLLVEDVDKVRGVVRKQVAVICKKFPVYGA